MLALFFMGGMMMLAAAPADARVPVYVMMPLDAVDSSGTLHDPATLASNFDTLRSAGAVGVMADVWWGIVERGGARSYDWGGYRAMFSLAASHGLRVQCVLSFHQCGGNVGDNCDVPLPSWALASADSQSLFYKDGQGNADREYLSLSADNEPVVGGRTARQVYSDFTQSFASEFADMLRNGTIVTVEVGLGPAGEWRYPSYQMSLGWQFPGIGAFQCWDKLMLADFRSSAASAGHPEWNSPPTNAGSYNSAPSNAPFFYPNSLSGDYADFFLSWYTKRLLQHGTSILDDVIAILKPFQVEIAAKIPGIHWLVRDPSHAAELTAGYYSSPTRNGYEIFARAMASRNVTFDFTALALFDSSQPSSCACAPQELVSEIASTVASAGGRLSGENALPVFDPNGLGLFASQAKPMDYVTYLRLGPTLMQPGNLGNFKNFVQNLAN